MKYILFIITFFICTIAQSQVKVLGYIAPNAPSDTYPTHLDINGSGGLMTMNTLAERNAIPILRRKKGMLVYVADSTATYQLQNDMTTWLPFLSNGGINILRLASPTVLGGIKVGNDFTIGSDSVMNISAARKNLWNQIALLPLYSTTDSMLSKIDSATTAHDYIFNDTDFIWSGRYVLLRHRYSPQDSLFMSSVAYNITQQDIDNWNASIDLSNFYNKSQVDSLIDSGFARHKYWFDGKTIKGDGTFVDPFHVDPFGDTTVVTYLNEHTYTTEQVDSAIAANYHIYGAGYGLILDNSTFILDTAALKLAFFINSVANSITQEDIDRWNESVDFSNFYTKAQVDSAFAAQALASRIYFDGVTIQGDGTALDPFHAVFGGDSGVANLYTRAQVDSAIAANYHIYGAGYGLLLQNSTFSVDTSVIHGGSGGSTIDTTAYLSYLSSKPDSVGLKSSTTTDTLVNYYPGGITLAKGVIDRQDGLISGAYVTWSGTGLMYDVTAGVYYINGVRYTSPAGSIILNAAHSTLDRIDVIAVDNTGSIVSVQGSPSATPTEPQVDPTSQIYLTSVYIPAGSTLPQGVVSNIVYNENTSPDWTVSSIGMTADADNTTAPYNLSKDISTGAWTSGNTVNFTGSTLLSASSLAAFKIFIRLKSVMANSASITVRFFNGGTAVSKALSVANYGFNKASVGGYQNISIPIADFVVTGTFNKIQVQFGGSNSTGVYIDYVQFQSGTGTVTNVNTVSNIYKKLGTDSVFMSFPSKNVFAYKDSVGSGGGSSLNGTGYVKATGTTISYNPNVPEASDINTLPEIKVYSPAKGVAASQSVANYSYTSVDSFYYKYSTTKAGSGTSTEFGGWLAPSTSGDSIEVMAPFWVLIGDSQAEGHPALHGRLHPSGVNGFTYNYADQPGQLSYHLRGLTNMRWYNQGIGGQTSTQIRQRFLRDALGFTSNPSDTRPTQTLGLGSKPQGVVIIAGINDISATITTKTTEDNLEWMASTCQQYGVKCVVLNLPGDALFNQAQLKKMQEVNQWLKQGALNQYGASVVDYNSWWKSPTYNDDSHPNSLITDDVHPSAVGYDSLANFIYRSANLPKLRQAIFANEISAVGLTGYSRPTGITINSTPYTITKSTDTINLTSYVPDSVWIKITSSTNVTGTTNSGFSHIVWVQDNNPTNAKYYTQKTLYTGSTKADQNISSLKIVAPDYTQNPVFNIKYTDGSDIMTVNAGGSTNLTYNGPATITGAITATSSGHRFGVMQLLTGADRASATGEGITVTGIDGQMLFQSTQDFIFQNNAGASGVRSLNTGSQSVVRINSGFTNGNASNAAANTLWLTPTFNFIPAGTTAPIGITARGLYYNPTTTSLNGVRHVGLEIAKGDVLIGSAGNGNGRTGIGVTDSVIDKTAALEIRSTSLGFLPPRLTSAQKANMGLVSVSGVTVTGGGSGYGITVSGTVTFTAAADGQTSAQGYYSTNSSGAITSVTVQNGGTYPVGTTPTITAATGTGATFTVNMTTPTLAPGLTIYCTDCTATDGSTGVMQTYNGSTWKNNW